MHSSTRPTIIWLFLITLSGIAAWIGEFGASTPHIVGFVILALIVKGQLVVDYFMGLNQVSWLWRGIMSAFCMVIGAIMFITYRMQ
ncbi:MAG: cytochrome C oxidase subunit IV family protein [Pseudomonadales bacterium]|nr:cytochrome C oxidase subunit IV family protein [Pseudomonadales bacterium]